MINAESALIYFSCFSGIPSLVNLYDYVVIKKLWICMSSDKVGSVGLGRSVGNNQYRGNILCEWATICFLCRSKTNV